MKSMMSFLLLLSVLSVPATANAMETYHLRYRGGGSIWFQFSAGVYGSPDAAVLFTNFTKSTNAQNPLWLEPGTCSWEDRNISAQEPSRLCQFGNGISGLTFDFNPRNPIVVIKDARNVAPYLRSLQSQDNYQGFWVYNYRENGCFVVTKID